MEKLIKNKQNWLVGLLLTMIVLNVLSFVFSIIYYSSLGVYATLYIKLVINTLINLALLTFALMSVKEKNTFWCKTLFVTYFSFVLFNNVFNFSNYFAMFTANNATEVFYNLGMFLDSLVVITIGIMYILHIAGIVKDVLEALVITRLVILLINFIIGIVAIAQGYLSWNTIIIYFIQTALTLLFFVATRKMISKGDY